MLFQVRLICRNYVDADRDTREAAKLSLGLLKKELRKAGRRVIRPITEKSEQWFDKVLSALVTGETQN